MYLASLRRTGRGLWSGEVQPGHVAEVCGWYPPTYVRVLRASDDGAVRTADEAMRPLLGTETYLTALD